jgi:hypothetical protein
MSAETELRAALIAATPVTALTGTRIASDRIDQGAARPFVVFTRTASEPFGSIDGVVLKTLVSLDVQAWADTRASADAVADAVTAAIRATPSQTVSGRSSGYDSELDLEATLLTVQWWE